MKKLLIVFISTLFVACSAKKDVSKSSALYEILTQQSDGGGNIQFYEILTEPNEIKMLLNDENLKSKIKTDDVANSNFVILNMGEKNSGGYSIEVSNVQETANQIIVTVKENKPDPKQITTQQITYPYTILKINSKKEIIIK